jgi:hypothetical protein
VPKSTHEPAFFSDCVYLKSVVVRWTMSVVAVWRRGGPCGAGSGDGRTGRALRAPSRLTTDRTERN